jgi:membrane protein
MKSGSSKIWSEASESNGRTARLATCEKTAQLKALRLAREAISEPCSMRGIGQEVRNVEPAPQRGERLRRTPAEPRTVSRKEGGLTRLLIVYAVLSLIAASGRSSIQPKKRNDPHLDDVHPGVGCPLTGPIGTRSKDEPRKVQHARANESDRGRRATVPWHWTGWKDILWRTYGQIGEDRLLAVAAGVVFYGLLALFPAVTAFVSLYGLFAKASTINEHFSLVGGLLPGGGVEIIQEQVNRIAAKGETKLGFAFAFGLGLALWSANAGMKALVDALNVIYDEKEKRGFIKLNFVSLVLTAGGILAILTAVGAIVVLPLVLSYVGLGGWTETLLRLLRWPVLIFVVIFGLAVLYRFGPSREHPRWEWLSVGSVLAAVAWLGSSALLSFYLANFANYDATYGSLGAAIGMMMWMWISSIVILVGAELNSEIEHQTARDSTTGDERPLGQRGAAMADTVGAAAS